jgi:hypothetical protein
MERRNVTTGVFLEHLTAEKAIEELRLSGFDLGRLSLIGMDSPLGGHVSGLYRIGEKLRACGKLEAFWQGLSRQFSSSASFFVPGIGPVMLFGPIVELVLAALERELVVGGLSAVGAALFSIGIPKECTNRYEAALRDGHFLLVAEGTADEAEEARRILNATSANDAVVYHSTVPGP